jgi:hypothetical protein
MSMMADGSSAGGMSNRDWMLEQVVGDGPALIVPVERGPGNDDSAGLLTDSVEGCDGRDAVDEPLAPRDFDSGRGRPHELDAPAGDSSSKTCGSDVNAGAKRAAVWLGAGVLAVAVLIVLALVVFGGGPDPVPRPRHHVTTAEVAAAPSTTNLPVPQQDHAVPFTARTDSCSPAGGAGDQLAARSPQALTDTGTDSAWVCGRGPQESLLDGQILRVQFACDPSHPSSACSYMLYSVSVTSGWVAKTPGGKDEWLQHRVVTRLQFNFFNGNQLVADPFFVDTRGVHGPVSATLPAKILASRVDVIILHTERPPVAPLPTTIGPSRAPDAAEAQPPGGLVVLGPASTEPATPPPPAEPVAGTATDPVDATFAMSQMQFFGHSPS